MMQIPSLQKNNAQKADNQGNSPFGAAQGNAASFFGGNNNTGQGSQNNAFTAKTNQASTLLGNNQTTSAFGSNTSSGLGFGNSNQQANNGLSGTQNQTMNMFNQQAQQGQSTNNSFGSQQGQGANTAFGNQKSQNTTAFGNQQGQSTNNAFGNQQANSQASSSFGQAQGQGASPFGGQAQQGSQGSNAFQQKAGGSAFGTPGQSSANQFGGAKTGEGANSFFANQNSQKPETTTSAQSTTPNAFTQQSQANQSFGTQQNQSFGSIGQSTQQNVSQDQSKPATQGFFNNQTNASQGQQPSQQQSQPPAFGNSSFGSGGFPGAKTNPPDNEGKTDKGQGQGLGKEEKAEGKVVGKAGEKGSSGQTEIKVTNNNAFGGSLGLFKKEDKEVPKPNATDEKPKESQETKNSFPFGSNGNQSFGKPNPSQVDQKQQAGTAEKKSQPSSLQQPENKEKLPSFGIPTEKKADQPAFGANTASVDKDKPSGSSPSTFFKTAGQNNGLATAGSNQTNPTTQNKQNTGFMNSAQSGQSPFTANSGQATGQGTGLGTGLGTGQTTGLGTGTATGLTTGLGTGQTTGQTTGLGTGQTTGQTSGQGSGQNPNAKNIQQLESEWEHSSKSSGERIEEWKSLLKEGLKEIKYLAQSISGMQEMREENHKIVQNFKKLTPAMQKLSDKNSVISYLDSIENRQEALINSITFLRDSIRQGQARINDHPTSERMIEYRELRKSYQEMSKGKGNSNEDPSNQQLSHIYSNLSSFEYELSRMKNQIDHYFGMFLTNYHR